MATETGTSVPSVIQNLLARPKRFSFFRAVHLLEAATSASAPVGALGPPSQERVRLRPSPSLAFPVADVEGVEVLQKEGEAPVYRLTTTFLGLYGVASPLPTFYSEEILEDVEEAEEGEEPATRALLDVIHHRLLSLLYRSFRKYRYIYQFSPRADDPLTRKLLCLIGLDPVAAVEIDPAQSVLLLAFAGLVTQHPRSAEGLHAFLQGLLGAVPLEVEQCVARWMEIPGDQRTALGRQAARLGQETVMGRRILDARDHFRLRLGPLGRPRFAELLPDGTQFRRLVGLTRFFVGLTLGFTVTLVLSREHASPVQLGVPGQGRLGWDGWLMTRKPDRDLSVDLTPSARKERGLW